MITVILVDQNTAILNHVTRSLSSMQKRGDIFLFGSLEEFLNNQPKEIDLILLDIDFYDLAALPKTLRSKVVALSDKTLMAYDQHVLGYMPKPLTATIMQSLLTEIIIQKEKEDIIVNTSNGYEKINIADINYVDIIKRNICYHLTSNIDVISVTIRKAFNNYVASLISNKNFVYVAPAFLINLSQIAQLSSDHVTFKNGAIVYVNKKQYTEIYSAWSK